MILRSKGVESMFCANCGKELDDGTVFCTKCGKLVDRGQMTSEHQITQYPTGEYQRPEQGGEKQIIKNLGDTPNVSAQRGSKSQHKKSKTSSSSNVIWIVIISVLSTILVGLIIAMCLMGKTMFAKNDKAEAIRETSVSKDSGSEGDEKGEQKELAQMNAKGEEQSQEKDTTIDESLQGDDKEQSDDGESATLNAVDENTFKRSCQEIEYEALARYPNNYVGDALFMYGEVVEVIEDDNKVDLRVNVGYQDYYYTDIVYVFYQRKDVNESRILEGDMVTIWATSNGLFTYENGYGGKYTLPSVNAEFVEIGDTRYMYAEGYDRPYSNSYILPNSDFYYVTEEDLKYLTKEQLRIARNEIYARYGRMFKDEQLQTYFDYCEWYVPSIPVDQFNESMLTEIEKYNVNFIKAYEDKLN